MEQNCCINGKTSFRFARITLLPDFRNNVKRIEVETTLLTEKDKRKQSDHRCDIFYREVHQSVYVCMHEYM